MGLNPKGILGSVHFRIETLGPFKLVDLQDRSTIHLRSSAKLLSHLAVRAPQFVSRKALVKELWPEAESQTANNRLRVALSKLRQLLPSAILEGPDGLTLSPEVVECDAAVFLRLVQESGDTTREEDELEALLSAFRYFCRNLGKPPFHGWDLHDLSEVLETFYKVSTRIATLALKLRRHDIVGEVCGTALNLWPVDPVLWKMQLQASLLLGQGESAVREVRATKDKALLADEGIRLLVQKILKGEADGSGIQFSADESQLAVDILKTMIASKQDVARIVLSSPETLTLAGVHPKQMLSLLERVVADPLYGDAHWERCVARIVGLKAWLSDADGVFRYSKEIVEHSTNPVILRAVWNGISLAYALRRKWPEAMEAIGTTIEFAGQTGSEMDVLSAEGNRAFFLCLQGLHDESVLAYDKSLERIKSIGSEQAEFDYIIGFGNRAFNPIFQGDWARASEWLEERNEMRTRRHDRVPLGTLLPAFAMVRMMLGHHEGVLGMLRQGFIYASESQSEQFQLITFEFAACTLACTEHKAYARAVMDLVQDWRSKINLPRAKAENNLCALVFGDQRADVRLTQADSPPMVGRELLRRLRYSLRG